MIIAESVGELMSNFFNNIYLKLENNVSKILDMLDRCSNSDDSELGSMEEYNREVVLKIASSIDALFWKKVLGEDKMSRGLRILAKCVEYSVGKKEVIELAGKLIDCCVFDGKNLNDPVESLLSKCCA